MGTQDKKPAEPAGPDERGPADELSRVQAYKFDRLILLGYDPDTAARLSRLGQAGVDVHYVEALLRRGATLEQAAQIAS